MADPLREEGFRVTVAPAICSLQQRQQLHRLERPDFVMFQKCRDPLHDPALFPESQFILDVDDADFLDPRLKDRMQRVASGCAATIAGSRFVAEWARSHCPRVEIVWTGLPSFLTSRAVAPSGRERVVVYAVSNALLSREEAKFVADVVVASAKRCRLTLQIHSAGEPSELVRLFRPVEAAGVSIRFVGWQSMENMVRSLRRAAVGLAPLMVERGGFVLGKSFGKILAYLAADVPIVCSDAVDHPLFFRNGVNGFVLPNEVSRWSEAVVTLIEDPAMRDSMASLARTSLHQRLTTKVAAKRIADVLYSLSTQSQRPEKCT